jgi:hypothetical protein
MRISDDNPPLAQPSTHATIALRHAPIAVVGARALSEGVTAMTETMVVYGFICSPPLLLVCISLVVLVRRTEIPDRSRAIAACIALLVVPLLMIVGLYLLGTLFPPEATFTTRGLLF